MQGETEVVSDKHRPRFRLNAFRSLCYRCGEFSLLVLPKLSMDQDRIISGAPFEEEQSYELSLRPKVLQEYIGQTQVKQNLEISVAAARSRGEALDHVLLYGPPGLGKTTLAGVIANELGVSLKTTTGPIIQIKGDLTAILTNLQANDVLFIDEIHRLLPHIEEILYPALEDFKLDLIIGQGPSARSVALNLPPFTLVGATTRAGLISSPLRSRFGIVHRLDYYTEEELGVIVRRSAEILGIRIDAAGTREIAARSRGTPRVANRLLRRVRDYAEVKADGVINRDVARRSLALLAIDDTGFDENDKKLIKTIIEKFSGGPVGVATLAAAISEEVDAIEDIYEPYLIQRGLLQRTPRGRMATRLAYEHFGLTPAPGQLSLL